MLNTCICPNGDNPSFTTQKTCNIIKMHSCRKQTETGGAKPTSFGYLLISYNMSKKTHPPL